jgi:membrane protein
MVMVMSVPGPRLDAVGSRDGLSMPQPPGTHTARGSGNRPPAATAARAGVVWTAGEGARRLTAMRALLSGFLEFMGRVVTDFRHNQGLLLSGAVAYYTLLSIVPLFVILLVALSHVVDERSLLETVETSLDLVVPGQSTIVAEQIAHLLANWETVGLLGVTALLFFSAGAFTVLEGAMSVIFRHRVVARRRRLVVSVLLPYVFISLVGVGMLLTTVISAALQAVGRESLHVFGRAWPLSGASGTALYALGVLGLAMLLTALYMLLPVGRVLFRHALIGGVTATVLWELMRGVLVWYFANLSVVNVIYGPLGTVIVLLLTLEIAALILLFGAQVVAEADRLRPRFRTIPPAAEAPSARLVR